MEWIGRRVEVRETKDKVEIQLDARRLVTHRRIAEAEHQRVMLAEHRPPRGQRDTRPDPHPEEKAIVMAVPERTDSVVGLKQRSRKAVTLALRQLLRLVREYPRQPLLGAVREAARYGLYDLDRLERMILRRVTRSTRPCFAWTKRPRFRRWIALTPFCPCRLGALRGMALNTSVTARCRCTRHWM